MPPPTFSSTRIIGASYITHHMPLPPVVIKPPLTTAENSKRPRHIPTVHIPAPMRPGTVAYTKASDNAKEALTRVLAKVRGITVGGSATSNTG